MGGGTSSGGVVWVRKCNNLGNTALLLHYYLLWHCLRCMGVELSAILDTVVIYNAAGTLGYGSPSQQCRNYVCGLCLHPLPKAWLPSRNMWPEIRNLHTTPECPTPTHLVQNQWNFTKQKIKLLVELSIFQDLITLELRKRNCKDILSIYIVDFWSIPTFLNRQIGQNWCCVAILGVLQPLRCDIHIWIWGNFQTHWNQLPS